MYKMKVFFIPHAGSSAINYIKFKKQKSDIIDIVPIELAGRGKRAKVDFYKDFKEAKDDMKNQITSLKTQGEKYSIFGHSMGGLLAFEVAHSLEVEGDKDLHRIFISGCSSPDSNNISSQLGNVKDEDFIKRIEKLGGIPQEVYEYSEIMDSFLKVLRQDIRIYDEYRIFNINKTIDKDIILLAGTEDQLCKNNLLTWNKYTSKNFECNMFEGGHFYLNDYISDIIGIIERAVQY